LSSDSSSLENHGHISSSSRSYHRRNRPLGFLVLVHALQSSYSVRLAIRNGSKESIIHSAPSIIALKPSPDDLTFVEVPDILAPGAYDEAVKGVDYVIHCASPITSGITDTKLLRAKIVDPAIRGTVGMLESAAKSASVKRVVITSSEVAFLPLSVQGGGSDEIFDGQKVLPIQPNDFEYPS